MTLLSHETASAPGVQVAIEEEFGWRAIARGRATLWVKGYLNDGGFTGAAFTGQVDRLIAAIGGSDTKGIGTLLRMLDGHYAICIATPDGFLAAVDRVRSIPLAYAPKGDGLVLDDQAWRLGRRLGLDMEDIDPDAALAFAMSGFTIGRATLYRGMKQLLPGEFLLCQTGRSAPLLHRYALYRPWCCEHARRDVLLRELADVTLGILEKLARSAAGRQILVPLSAGLDSRLIVSGLAHLGYRNVRCFSYGIKDNYEAAAASKIAAHLGYEWTFVRFTHRFVRTAFLGDCHRRYHEFADNAAATPVEHDFLALMRMDGAEWVDEDAILVNGQSGDYITGAHIPLSLSKPLYCKDRDERDAIVFDAIVAKHYDLWPNLRTQDNLHRIKTMLWNELEQAGAPFDNQETSFALYEFSEFQNRQCKYVVAGQRAYEFFGYEWRLPLWDKDYLQFWESVPLSAKIDRNLFRAMLKQENWGGVWRDIPTRRYVTPRWIVPLRFAVKVACGPFGKAFWHRLERRIFAYWTDDLCKYAIVPYHRVLLENRAYRNAISWLSYDYLTRKGLCFDGTTQYKFGPREFGHRRSLMTDSLSLVPPETLEFPLHTSGCTEMFGLCGAGKTTIAAGLAPLFQTEELRLDVARPISPGGIGTIYNALCLALRATVSDPVKVSQFLMHDQGRRLFLKLGLRTASMAMRKAYPRTLLIDSGVLQPLVSFVVEQNERKLEPPLRALMAVVPFPAAAIYVRVDPELAYRRYISRQTRSGILMADHGLRSRFDHGLSFCEWLYDYCNYLKLPTMVIDSSDHLDSNHLVDVAERIGDPILIAMRLSSLPGPRVLGNIVLHRATTFALRIRVALQCISI